MDPQATTYETWEQRSQISAGAPPSARETRAAEANLDSLKFFRKAKTTSWDSTRGLAAQVRPEQGCERFDPLCIRAGRMRYGAQGEDSQVRTGELNSHLKLGEVLVGSRPELVDVQPRRVAGHPKPSEGGLTESDHAAALPSRQ